MENETEEQYQARLADIAKEREAQRRADIARNFMKGAGFPLIAADFTFENIERNEPTYGIAVKYAQNFNPKYGEGLLFVGVKGCGKTTLAVCIGKALCARGFSAKFTSMAKIMLDIEKTYKSKSTTAEDVISEIISKDLLIIDDFPRVALTERRIESAHLLIDELYNGRKSVIITANPEQIALFKENVLLSAANDRLRVMCPTVKFADKNYRDRSVKKYD